MVAVVQFPGADGKHLGKMPRERVVEPITVAQNTVENAPRLDMLLVLGVTHDGELYAASSHPDIADSLLLTERFKRKMMRAFGDDEFAD